MNYQEVKRIEVVKLVETKVISQKDAASFLNIGTRQMRRIQKRYRSTGIDGVLSKLCGKPSNNCLCPNFKLEISTLIKEKYADLDPKFVHKKINEKHNRKISGESIRKIMIECGIWTPRTSDADENHHLQPMIFKSSNLIEEKRKLYDWF
ncbi:MAG: helix-turn-helix domain-containing protein [Alcanivoracaceae bacterium]|nr:helix-turn-helix domain-containing protein [Alcanivoracaceae bacterium]